MTEKPDIMRAEDYVENLYAIMTSQYYQKDDNVEIIYLEDIIDMLKQLEDDEDGEC